MKKIFIVILVFSFILSCKNDKANKTKNEIIKIGAILPLTGSLATYGQSGKEGMTIALDEFNTEFPNKVKLVLEDDKGSVKDGISAVNKLITNDKVQIIMGAMSSGVTLGIAPILEKNKIVLVSPTSTASEVTNAGDYIFRVCVSDVYEGKAMANYVCDSLKYKNLGVVYINNDYGVGLKNNFIKGITTNNKTVDFEQGYDPKTTDFKTIIQKLKEAKVDLLYIVAQKEQLNFFKNCKELDYKPQFIGSTMIEDKELLGELQSFLKGTKYTYRSYDPNSKQKVSSNFVTKYKAKYNKIPDFYAASVYDATRLILYTVSKVNYTGDDMKTFLYNIKDYEAVTGVISFDENGDVTQGFTIKEVK